LDKLIGSVILLVSGFIVCAGLTAQAAEQPADKSLSQGPSVVNRTSPFLTLQEERSLEKQGSTIPITYLEVTAVFYSSNAEHSRVIIEGRVLAIGDTIDNKKIVAINPEEVILKDSQGYYVVRMKKISLAMNPQQHHKTEK